MKIVNVALACMSILTISSSLVTAQTGVAVAKPARAAHAQPGVVAMPHRFSATSSESAKEPYLWIRISSLDDKDFVKLDSNTISTSHLKKICRMNFYFTIKVVLMQIKC